MPGISSALAANSRYDRLEDANRNPVGPRACGGSGRRPMRLHAAPRSLARSGDAYARAWDLADDGAISGRAYMIADGWHWVGIADETTGATAGAVLMTIGPDGKRTADRYGVSADARADLARYFEDDARGSAELPTPAHFWQFAGCQFVPWLELISDDLGADDAPSSDIPHALEVEYLAALKVAEIPPACAPVPALEPLRWAAAATVAPVAVREPLRWVAELPEVATIRAQFAAMVAGSGPELRPSPVLADEIPTGPEPVAQSAPRWRRVALAVARAIYGGWWDGVPELRRPVLISRAELC